jgi:hypothetical protein
MTAKEVNAELEKAFGATTRALFGQALTGLGEYGNWLQSRIPGGSVVNSALGGETAYLPDYSFFSRIPKGRIASLEDFASASEAKISVPIEGASFDSLVGEIRKIAWFVPDYSEGINREVTESALPSNSAYMHRTVDVWDSKRISFGFAGMENESCFGMYRFKGCKFSVHCYNAFGLTSCFEMDHCRACTDSMFCHNCENVSDSLFCFNAKNLKRAIGNVEYPAEEYRKLRAQIVGQMADELKKRKSLRYDIYNIGCAK